MITLHNQHEVGRTFNVPMTEDLTLKKGDAVKLTAGKIAKAEAADTVVNFVAQESKTTLAGDSKKILTQVVGEVAIFECDANNDVTEALIGVEVALADENTIDTTTTEGPFTVLALAGTRKVLAAQL